MSSNGHSELGEARDLFRIGQVSRLTDTKPFVLRYWETEFPMLQPVKSPKGHRLYRREDVETVLRIKRLLYDEGFTIAGARRHLREGNGAAGEAPAAHTESAAGHQDAAATEEHASAPRHERAERRPEPRPEADLGISRKVLLDLRDELRAFLTLLESE